MANRRRYAGGALDGSSRDELDARARRPPGRWPCPTDPADVERYEAAFARFCATFPDAFFVSERARVYLDHAEGEEERGTAAERRLPQHDGLLPRRRAALRADPRRRRSRRELDALWQEFDFITAAPMRQYTSFIWFERAEPPFMRDPEFDFARAEDKDATSEAKIKRLAEVYLAKARADGASDVALEAIDDHFRDHLGEHSPGRAGAAGGGAEPRRGPPGVRRAGLSPAAVDGRSATTSPRSTARSASQDGLSHEDAVRDTVVSVLMSPHFCYRVDLPAAGTGVQPLSDYALASRLSYFLWSSMPDEELLARAAAGDLHRPEVLVAAGPADAARRPRPRPGHRVRRQLARLPPLRGAQQRRSRAVPELQRRAAAGDVRGADPLLRRPGPRGPLGARPARRESHVRQPGPRPALRHARARASGPTSGCGSTTRAGTAAAGSCRWRSS